MQRLADCLTQVARRARDVLGLGRQQRGDRAQQHQAAHQHIGIAPANPLVRHDQRQAAGRNHRQPVAHDLDRRAGAAFLLAQHVRAIGVERDVLRGGQECDQHRQHGQRHQRGGRRQRPHHHDRHGQQQLRQQHPAPAPTQQGRHVAVNKGSPKKLDGVGSAHQRKKPDFLKRHPFDGGPGLQGTAG
ncbi:hypothetical protein D3C87_1389370 [compost metagenome]